MKLSEAALADFKTKGFVFLPELFSREEAALLLDEAKAILDRYEAPWSVIGKFTESMRCQVIFDPNLCGNQAGCAIIRRWS